MDDKFSPGEILLALDLSLEFGEGWRRGIQSRLLEKISGLTEERAEALEHRAFDVRDTAIQTVVSSVLDGKGEVAILDGLRNRYPWLDEERLGRLLRQGQYYAAKQ